MAFSQAVKTLEVEFYKGLPWVCFCSIFSSIAWMDGIKVIHAEETKLGGTVNFLENRICIRCDELNDL